MVKPVTRHRLRLGHNRTDCGLEVGRFVPNVPGGVHGLAGQILVTRTVDGVTCTRCERKNR